ncbi:MAG: 3-dehydroquinate synthase [Clostridia bacterium]|nr:3-dehydroquinate synthase [Clostridia bacterium]
MKTLRMELGERSYDITVGRGLLASADRFFRLDRKVLVVTDDGVPPIYAETLAARCASPVTVTLPQGEANKNFDSYRRLLSVLAENAFTRSDCVAAVGGGVAGDLAGFAAATYLRGIDFYNLPTTLLAQVDSSIGGKTAIDFAGYKNLVGAFWQPKGVLIDPDVLSTLPRRQLANGAAEAIKMALTSDAALFSLFETGEALRDLDTVILRSLAIKKSVVEQDETEAGLRRILNFGHTLAHAIESAEGLSGYLHGECVALGMIPMVSDALRPRLLRVLSSVGLPVSFAGDPKKLAEAVRHDKKTSGDKISVVFVPEPGRFEIRTLPLTEYQNDVIRFAENGRKPL